MNLGVTELLIVFAIVLLIFGSTQLPKLARSFGRAKSEFERGERDVMPSDPEIDERAR